MVDISFFLVVEEVPQTFGEFCNKWADWNPSKDGANRSLCVGFQYPPRLQFHVLILGSRILLPSGALILAPRSIPPIPSSFTNESLAMTSRPYENTLPGG